MAESDHVARVKMARRLRSRRKITRFVNLAALIGIVALVFVATLAVPEDWRIMSAVKQLATRSQISTSNEVTVSVTYAGRVATEISSATATIVSSEGATKYDLVGADEATELPEGVQAAPSGSRYQAPLLIRYDQPSRVAMADADYREAVESQPLRTDLMILLLLVFWVAVTGYLSFRRIRFPDRKKN